MNTYSLKSALTKSWKEKYSQPLLLLLTGFFFTQFLLLNILYAQHPLGGWQTAVGNISTKILLAATLISLLFCLVVLWRSATSNRKVAIRKTTSNYSIPTTFINISSE